MQNKIFDYFENITISRAVRNGLVNLIPVLIIGAFALIFNTFPVYLYQNFVDTFLGGFLRGLFNFVYDATFGVLSVYMTYSVSHSYMKIKADAETVNSGAAFVSLICFFILSGAYLPDFGLEQMGPKAMFLAIFTALGASALYNRLTLLFRGSRLSLLSTGVDREFNRMISSFFPILVITAIFAFGNMLLTRIFDARSFHELFARLFNIIFSFGKTGFLKGFFFVLLSSILWFFGIHGSDALEGVMQTYFVPGLAANQAAVASGAAPTAILTKEFFDCFVLMGGCGATICLLITILIFSKNRAQRSLGLAAAFPMLFNINELMVFGLPIIFNPAMLIPFLLVPLACYSIAYAAISLGLVSMITNEVAWTTPILLGGFRATGSLSGTILQIVNVIVGVSIYLPFLRKYEYEASQARIKNFDRFMNYYKQNEAKLQSVRLTDYDNIYGDFAKALTADLRHDLKKSATLFYQPQYNYDSKCVGVEALLRWEHPVYGMLYPPLVIKLMDECGELEHVEEMILLRALEDRPAVLKKFGENIKLSVNVTGTVVTTAGFLYFCRELNEKEAFAGKNICLEVTEQSVLSLTPEARNVLNELREMGLTLAIDDFSMGNTSISYLTYNLFDVIKIDGALVRGLLTAQNCREIIATISSLSKSLNVTVLAEFVETEEQREILHEIGCDIYQGFLYSPAVPL